MVSFWVPLSPSSFWVHYVNITTLEEKQCSGLRGREELTYALMRPLIESRYFTENINIKQKIKELTYRSEQVTSAWAGPSKQPTWEQA